MAKRPNATRRWLTAATWPVGVAMTSWDYMWRSTPMHRRETTGSAPAESRLLTLPEGVSADEVQGHDDGHGPLFHRRYRTRIAGSQLSAENLMARVQSDPNQAAPSAFAKFQKMVGEPGGMKPGDEYVVRMPGPWDGPVRVAEVSSRSFRLATLTGHLEAGQIEFRAGEAGEEELTFEIESWARSSTWLTNLLYHTLRMSKEVQAHMWISFLEGVVELAGGRMKGGVSLDTDRLEEPGNGR